MHFKDFKFESSVVFSCHEGFVLRGANVSICTDSGKWSEQIPTCEPVSCPHAPVLEFGRLLTYHPREANISYYLDFARYECLPKYALFGNETITCTASGNWSQLPECRDVKCQRPTEIKNGFMTFSLYREYHYQEVVTYGCNPTYVLEGPRSSFCDKDGNWTTKPVCRAPCHLTTSKAVVLHNGRKTKVEKISNQLINHADTITYYCKDPDKKCSHLVDTQCLDGNLVVPSCYTNNI
ncbi:beta-2-glycoprotein 1 [Rhinophrynus dorsalis]